MRQAANKAVLGTHHMSVLVHVPVEGRSQQAALKALIRRVGPPRMQMSKHSPYEALVRAISSTVPCT